MQKAERSRRVEGAVGRSQSCRLCCCPQVGMPPTAQQIHELPCKLFACSSPALAFLLKELLLHCTAPALIQVCVDFFGPGSKALGEQAAALGQFVLLVHRVDSACDCLASVELARKLASFLQEGRCKCGPAQYWCMPNSLAGNLPNGTSAHAVCTCFASCHASLLILVSFLLDAM